MDPYSCVQHHLVPDLPLPVVEIICAYAEIDQEWEKVARSRTEAISRIFFTIVTIPCQSSRYEGKLNDALVKGDIETATLAIKWGATPVISGEQFLLLLKNNKRRSLNFILTQMRHLDTENEKPSFLGSFWEEKQSYDADKTVFKTIRKAVEKLDASLFTTGFEFYLKHVPRLCSHDVASLRKACPKEVQLKIEELCSKKVTETCTCSSTSSSSTTGSSYEFSRYYGDDHPYHFKYDRWYHEGRTLRR